MKMNRKKAIYTVAGIAVGAFCLYHSVYITSLSARNEELMRQNFKPEQTVAHFWENDLEGLLEKAVELRTFDSLLVRNPQSLAQSYGKTLGIGAPYSIIVRGTGTIDSIGNERIYLHPVSAPEPGGKPRVYAIQTAFIFSNTVREASGAFHIDDFENTMDFNLISAELNRRIVEEVAAPMAEKLKPGEQVDFYGAADVHPGKAVPVVMVVVPLRLTVAAYGQQ